MKTLNRNGNSISEFPKGNNQSEKKQNDKSKNNKDNSIINSKVDIKDQKDQQLNIKPEENFKNYPHQINHKMSDEDYNTMIEAEKNNELQFFIEHYQKKYSFLSEKDVISLGIMEGINNFDGYHLITKMLYSEKNNLDIKPLLTLDKNGNNAIYHAIKEEMGISILMSYISGTLNKYNINTKFDMSDELIQKFAHVIVHTPRDTPPQLLIDELLIPLYTEESVAKVIEVIGQDVGYNWLDTFYI